MTSNQKGMTLIYVMITLVILGFVISSLVRMTNKNSLTQINYSHSETARSLTVSGINYAKSYFTNPDNADEILELLQKHMDNDISTLDDEYIWLNKSGKNYDTIAKNNEFKVEILGFDYDNFAVYLKSHGRTINGKATNLSTFIIDGVGFEEVESVLPVNAIHLDGDDNFEMNCSLVVHGNTYFGGKMVMNNKGCVFDGDFFMNKNNKSTVINQGAEFKGKTYLGGDITFASRNAIFREDMGFEGFTQAYNRDCLPLLYGDMYHNNNADLGYGGGFNLRGNDVHTYRGLIRRKCYNFDDIYTYSTKIDIPEELDLTPSQSIPFDTTVWENVNIKTMYDGQRIHGGILNKWYADAVKAGDTLKGGFMVVRAPINSSEPIGVTPANNTPFTGKVVFIMKNPNLSLINFYESSSSANSVLYIEGHTQTYMTELENFRGVIYVANGGLTIKAKTTYITGSVYHAKGAYHKYDNDGGLQLMDITYSKQVLEEAALTGIFHKHDTTVDKKLILTNDGKINLFDLSRSF